MLRATTVCTFSTSQLPKVVRPWCVLYILTSKCASHHNGVQFFISHLASWLRTRRFSEPTFRPSGAPNHWKNTVFRDFPTFSHICIFFLLIFSLLTLLTSAFQLSILSEVSLLNFLRLNGDFIGNIPYFQTNPFTGMFFSTSDLFGELICSQQTLQPKHLHQLTATVARNVGDGSGACTSADTGMNQYIHIYIIYNYIYILKSKIPIDTMFVLMKHLPIC